MLHEQASLSFKGVNMEGNKPKNEAQIVRRGATNGEERRRGEGGWGVAVGSATLGVNLKRAKS